MKSLAQQPSPDEALSAIAQSQFGLVTRQQAIDAGLNPAAVRHRVETGRFVGNFSAPRGLLSDMITAMIHAPHLIRGHRLAAGLSLRQLALQAGTSAATLSRYESGDIDPTVGTLNRILGACSRRRRRWASLAQLAQALVSRSLDESDGIWRLVGEFLDDSGGADDEEFVQSVIDPPLPTGEPWADALLAALGEYLSAERGISPPPWTQAPVEAVPWWFVAGNRFAARALRESPPGFARRGIFVTSGALERV